MLYSERRFLISRIEGKSPLCLAEASFHRTTLALANLCRWYFENQHMISEQTATMVQYKMMQLSNSVERGVFAKGLVKVHGQ